MQTIHIQTQTPYDVLIQNQILQRAGEEIQKLAAYEQVIIVTDDIVDPLYGNALRQSLSQAGICFHTFIFPHGERSKKLQTLSELYDFLADYRITRQDCLIALGGGVVGDLAGFAAASFLRGIDFIQIPTTLLAQVDSSVGGKTGIDIPAGKNLVGAFYQPRLVLCDPDTLHTLPSDVFSDGMAEVIKYAAAFSETMFAALEHGRIQENLDSVVEECIRCKKRLVESDETESGPRMLLNFGHTFGHAIEMFYGYDGFTHGQAVAVGMHKITSLSEQYGLTKQGTANRLESLLKQYQLPVQADLTLRQIFENSLTDKKRSSDGITLALISEIGRSFLLALSLSDYQRFALGDYSS